MDSVLVIITSFMAGSRNSRIALRIQGAIGIIAGILLYWVFFEQVRLYWFLILIAAQTLATSVGEFLVVRHSKAHAISRWNYGVAAVSLTFSCVYLYLAFAFQDRLAPQDTSWFIYGYLLAFGVVQCLTAARMLYEDFHPQLSGEAK